MLTGGYQPGTSLLHRAGAGVKLLGLLAFSTALVVWRLPVMVLVCLCVVVVLYGVGGFGIRTFAAQVWPLRWFVLFLLPFQWWTAGWQAAVGIVGTLVLAVLGAGLVSLTTRVTDLLDVVTRLLQPARAVGVDPDRVALLLTLTIRAVPVIAGTLQEARDARRARGLERSTRALVTPVVVRTIRHADRVGDALAARGVDD
ncbi:MAG TPA: energy-coupling factor transporter transmembrane protein EcfT [Streptosporangiaceae bacterium]|nr:energy-coupling factor transporter transmembrane protein EcfT [Streptosporangiaceae bacterium]